MSHTESFETVAGCRIRILRKGAGAPLLFLHGASGVSGWLPFMEALSQHHDLIVPEHPGFGASDTPGWLDGIGDLAYFYLDLIAQMGLSGVHLMGSSLGGWIAAEMAIRDPRAMRSLTLISPAGIQVKGVQRGDIFMWSPAQTAQNLFHDPDLAARVPLPSTDAEMMQALKNRETTARLGWNPRLHNPDLPKWLHRVAVPTLIVWGDDDRVLPAAYGPAFRDLIPGAELTILPECGHLPHVEKTAAFTATALPFLQRAA
jgi:pimeloyl-ACP methyl ester carboxylesterase